MTRTARVAWLCLVLLLFSAHAAKAQQSPQTETLSIPFEKWVVEGDREQIPWDVYIPSPRLRVDQRLAAGVVVSVSGKSLKKSGPAHELFALVRFADADGAWVGTPGLLRKEVEQPLPNRTHLDFFLDFVVLPGDYSVVVLLYDRTTGQRSLLRRPLRVPSIKKDPLPELARNLPRVEFLPLAEGLDAVYVPSLKDNLWLPVSTTQPVRVELLVNFTPSQRAVGRRGVTFNSVATVLAALKVLAQMKLSNGSLHITALDLMRRQVLFEQNHVSELDWPRLREALAALDAPIISADALGGRKKNAAFFREVLARRLADSAGVPRFTESSAGGQGRTADEDDPEPLRVFIVVTSAVLFEPGTDLKPLPVEGECNCRVYHLRFHPFRGYMLDELEKVMKPLAPRRYDLLQPKDFRKALAAIVADLHKL